MKVVLRADVPSVGNKGDLVDVSDGYARNYLVPQGLALTASDGAVRQAESMRRSRTVRDRREREGAETTARQLTGSAVTVTARAGEDGRLFGSVTSANVVDAVQEQTGIELDRRRLLLDEPIKELGEHEIQVRLHADVTAIIRLEVVAG